METKLLAPERLTEIRALQADWAKALEARPWWSDANAPYQPGNYAGELLSHADALEARAATLEAQVRELQAGAKPNPFLPADDWGDDDGAVMWWTFPICEPPYVGSPADCDWNYENTFTHYQKFDLRGYDDERAYRDFASAAPEQPEQPAPQGGGRAGQEGGRHE